MCQHVYDQNGSEVMFNQIITTNDTIIVEDDDGFTFKISRSAPRTDEHEAWAHFLNGFVIGYYDRGMDPVPNLVRYMVWYDKQWQQWKQWKGMGMIESIMPYISLSLPQYVKRIERLMLLR